jgi:hypothetical protein
MTQGEGPQFKPQYCKKKKKKRKKKNMIQIHDNFYRPDKTGEGERDRSGSRTLQVK